MKEIATHAHTLALNLLLFQCKPVTPHAVKSWQAHYTPGEAILFGRYHSAGEGGYGSALQAYETSLTGINRDKRDLVALIHTNSVCAHIYTYIIQSMHTHMQLHYFLYT